MISKLMRYDQSLVLLWLFLIFQIVILFCYLKFSSSWNSSKNDYAKILQQPVKFVQLHSGEKKNALSLNKYQTYYSADLENEVYLKTENVEDYFLNVNNTICFKYGTDIDSMKRNNLTQETGTCKCLPGYHGNDCSLPEVLWRAFIAFREETVLHKRKNVRRIIYMFSISHPAQISLATIMINELYQVVDLFIVVETNKTEFGESKPMYFKEKLDKGLLERFQYKIIHSPVFLKKRDYFSPSAVTWKQIKKITRNLKNDDLFIQLDNSVIPNSKALLFFKLFDGFSLPLIFRLKWNVYGYFYQHPNKTMNVKTGSTVKMLNDNFFNGKDLINVGKGLVVGDLNHYGGWYCDLCYDPEQILNVVQVFNEFEKHLLKIKKVVDKQYIEELIGDGLYVDGTTTLVPNQEGKNHYYAPDSVTKNYWKYDSLMINFYTKPDYK